ncbi:IS110 family RNA-guided transposase [Litoreibacter arenae]|uniref:Mobile element protein n=1 Tax=Litoreibacter arenae DSM 19593 TaxID=1123360 RepID=S9RRI4_9RHOB|nr:IS110 family transposase [Litoreibacter arenae]EPX80610.1 Mobile element protein [Litoreibacter arenae DSM 19593]
MAKTTFDELMSIGIDIGKDIFHIVAFDPEGHLVMRKQIKRLALVATFDKLPRSVVGMEACLSARFVSRTLRKMGFELRIIPAIYVKPFIKGQKNDYNDAEAIAEAALRPNLQTVPEKNQEHLDLQALNRVRSRRTATINQIRAFLIEQGITVRKGLRALKNSFEKILEERKDEVSPRMREILIGLYGAWLWLDDRIDTVSKEIEQISRTEENCVNVITISGIGPMISTAMVAAIGTGEAFGRGRDFAAWVGLIPRQYSRGGRTVLGRITKRGSWYLRMLFVQAAKVILMRTNRWPDFSFGAWLTKAAELMNRNKLAVALTNKLARMAWSILRHKTAFDAPRDEAAIGV